MKAADSAAAQLLWSQLRAQIQEWTGVVLGSREADSALRTLVELAQGRGQSATDYLRSLDSAQQAVERQRLIDRLIIGVTWFLREAAGLQALAAALRRRHGAGAQVRIWSAGCSTGQEPYGIAMTLVEAGLHPRILATDINHESLRIAAAASYPLRSLAALPAAWQKRYVHRRGSGSASEHGVIQPAISSLVTFGVHNLASASKPPEGWSAFDAVVCRNVLMYFERARATDVVRRLARSCQPGGYVLLSAAERPLVWMTQVLEEADGDHDVVLLRRAAALPASRHDEQPAPKPPPASAAPALAAPTPSPVKGVLAEVRRLMASAELGQALERLQSLFTSDPLHAEAHLLRGLLLKRLGMVKEAVVALRCARFLFSDEAWLPPYHLALALEQLGEVEEACEAYRHARSVVAAGSRSGLSESDGHEEALALTVAEACSARLRALRAHDAADRPHR